MFDVKLKNGRKVLDWRMRPGGVGEKSLIGVVLVELGDDEHDKFVTWEIGLAADSNDFDAWSGHYFQSLYDAEDDFRSRARSL